MSGFKKVLKGVWDDLELYLMVLCLDLFMVNILLQIITRLIFKTPLTFTEEVSRYLFVWLVYLALPYSTYYNKHIYMDFVVHKLPPFVQKVFRIIIHIITIAVFLWVVRYGFAYMDFVHAVNIPALGISKAIIAFIIPFSGLLMLVRSTQRILIEFGVLKDPVNR